ncbi:MAG: cupredoxin domain-containing protein [Longimicrobiales bacterium]
MNRTRGDQTRGSRWSCHKSGTRAGRLSLVVLAFAWSAGCFSERSDSPAEPEFLEDTLVEVRLTDFAFSPANIAINRGTRVRWINTTNTFHTVTPDGHSEWQRWPTSTAADTLEHTFTTAGDFAYFCEPHRTIGMVGAITVR